MLHVLYMPMDASLACWALFLYIFFIFLPTSFAVETVGGEGRDVPARVNRLVSLRRNDATAAADPLATAAAAAAAAAAGPLERDRGESRRPMVPLPIALFVRSTLVVVVARIG